MQGNFSRLGILLRYRAEWFRSYWMCFEELLFWEKEFETIVGEFRWDLDFEFSTWNVHFGKEKLECNEISRLRILLGYRVEWWWCRNYWTCFEELLFRKRGRGIRETIEFREFCPDLEINV